MQRKIVKMQDLTNGNEGKLIFKFAAPMLLGNVFQQLFSVVDSVVVGNFVGKEALAALVASFPIACSYLSLWVCMGITALIYFRAEIHRVISAIDTMYIASTIGDYWQSLPAYYPASRC